MLRSSGQRACCQFPAHLAFQKKSSSVADDRLPVGCNWECNTCTKDAAAAQPSQSSVSQSVSQSSAESRPRRRIRLVRHREMLEAAISERRDHRRLTRSSAPYVRLYPHTTTLVYYHVHTLPHSCTTALTHSHSNVLAHHHVHIPAQSASFGHTSTPKVAPSFGLLFLGEGPHNDIWCRYHHRAAMQLRMRLRLRLRPSLELRLQLTTRT